jgi:hypothetical protein
LISSAAHRLRALRKKAPDMNQVAADMKRLVVKTSSA